MKKILTFQCYRLEPVYGNMDCFRGANLEGSHKILSLTVIWFIEEAATFVNVFGESQID